MKHLSKVSLLLLLTPVVALASVSIGLSAPRQFNLGTVHPNKLYNVGVMGIINTGDEYGCFKMETAYHSDQPELRLPAEWVQYNPSNFCLEPGVMQVVDVKVKVLPPVTRGDYFAFVTGCTDFGGNLGACVGTKLYLSLNKK